MANRKIGNITINELYKDMFSTYDDVITADEVATMLNLPRKRVYRMIRSGEILSMKYERTIRVAKVWVIDYIQKYGFQRQESFANERRAKVIAYCQTPRSRKQIQEYLDISDKKYFRETVLHPLIEDGVLEMTIPENPQSVYQRYVATTKIKQQNETE